MFHGYAVTSTLLADPPSNETTDVFYIKTDTPDLETCAMPENIQFSFSYSFLHRETAQFN